MNPLPGRGKTSKPSVIRLGLKLLIPGRPVAVKELRRQDTMSSISGTFGPNVQPGLAATGPRTADLPGPMTLMVSQFQR